MTSPTRPACLKPTDDTCSPGYAMRKRARELSVDAVQRAEGIREAVEDALLRFAAEQIEECAKVCSRLYTAKEVENAWDEGEATGYQEAETAIRSLLSALRPGEAQ